MMLIKTNEIAQFVIGPETTSENRIKMGIDNCILIDSKLCQITED